MFSILLFFTCSTMSIFHFGAYNRPLVQWLPYYLMCVYKLLNKPLLMDIQVILLL